MKKLLLFFLFSGTIFAQQQVFNVQHYCIDELPLKQNSCDVSGNEYSFVFVDSAKKEVVLFLASQKLSYTISASRTDRGSGSEIYDLKSGQTSVTMKINKVKNRIEFQYADRVIYLKAGKSTKAES